MQFFTIFTSALLATMAVASPVSEAMPNAVAEAVAAPELDARAVAMIDLWQDA
jgi:hypothetical protein